MATNCTPSFDDLDPIENDFEDDAEEIQLEPGESIVGEIREINTGHRDYNSTLLHISCGNGDVVKLRTNRQIDAQRLRADLSLSGVIGNLKTETRAVDALKFDDWRDSLIGDSTNRSRVPRLHDPTMRDSVPPSKHTDRHSLSESAGKRTPPPLFSEPPSGALGPVAPVSRHRRVG